jgi:hypothetical protein
MAGNGRYFLIRLKGIMYHRIIHHPSFIPEEANIPAGVCQGTAPVCGLAALLVILFARLKAGTPRPELNDLLGEAKKSKFTEIGPIFHIQYLKALLDKYHIESEASIEEPVD